MTGTPLVKCGLSLLPLFSPLRSPTYMSIHSIRFPEVLLAPPTPLPCFYPHFKWAVIGPVQVGVRSKAQVHHHDDGPGLLGAAIYAAISGGSRRSTQSPEQGGGCLCLPKLLEVCWPQQPSTHVGCASSSGFPNTVARNGSALVACSPCLLPLAGYAASPTSAVGAPWRSCS